MYLKAASYVEKINRSSKTRSLQHGSYKVTIYSHYINSFQMQKLDLDVDEDKWKWEWKTASKKKDADKVHDFLIIF